MNVQTITLLAQRVHVCDFSFCNSNEANFNLKENAKCL